jgi:putative transposase
MVHPRLSVNAAPRAGKYLCSVRMFFPWYNDEHRHSGIAYLTPSDVHYGRAAEVIARRQQVLTEAHHAHPERFPRGMPKAQQLPTAVWINPPLPVDQVSSAPRAETEVQSTERHVTVDGVAISDRPTTLEVLH